MRWSIVLLYMIKPPRVMKCFGIALFVLLSAWLGLHLSAEEVYTPQISFFADESEGWAMKTIGKFLIIGAVIVVVNFLIFVKLLSRYKKSRFLNMIYLHQVMIKDPITVELSDSLSSVAAKFKQYNIRYVPVVSELKYLEGIVSRDDMDKQLASFQESLTTIKEEAITPLESIPAKKAMVRSFTALSPHDMLSTAVKAMENSQCKCIPVVDNNNCLLGIITENLIVHALDQYILKPVKIKHASVEPTTQQHPSGPNA